MHTTSVICKIFAKIEFLQNMLLLFHEEDEVTVKSDKTEKQKSTISQEFLKSNSYLVYFI
jgi:hypothetical protein